ncbi:MAG: PEP-CTERM sorting domain-containing protein [Phycisphaerae bacterium]
MRTEKKLHVAVVLSAVIAGLGIAGHASAAAIFSDTFGSGSDINNATTSSPTATSTSYQVASTKSNNPAPSITAGDLNVGLVSTSSGVTETQALFANSPVALTTAGDFVNFRMTFTNHGVGVNTSDTMYFGLYNSGGSKPVNGLLQAGLTTGDTTHATDGVAGWQGYVWQLAPTATTSTGKVITRPVQGSGTNSDQDLVANGASGGTFNTPKGDTISPNLNNGSAAGLTDGAQYTMDLLITLNGDGSETLAANLYPGTDTSGTAVDSQSVTTSTTPLVSSYDGLAFGWRHSGVSAATSYDVSSITVSSNIGVATPEPASLGVLAMGGLALLARRRKA